MADQPPVIHIGENSPEQVALKLVEVLSRLERKALYASNDRDKDVADRKWLLDTYAECLTAVKGYRSLSKND
jgi:hypothetical protein